MKRDEFLKTMITIGGGFALVSCSKDLIGDFAEGEDLQTITIDEAKRWFNESYYPKYSNLRVGADSKDYKRTAAWNRSQKIVSDSKREFVWVPMDYEDTKRPGVIVYTKETAFRVTLAKYFLQPVLEGLIVLNDGGKKKAFLAQIAYDQFSLASNNYQIEKSKFSGTLIRAEWDDALIDGLVYEKGKIVHAFKNAENLGNVSDKKARIADCITYYLSYNTTYVDSNNAINIVVHKDWQTICSGDSGGGFGGAGGGGGYGDGGSGGNGGNGGNYPGGGNYYDPLVNSGGGNLLYPQIPQLYNFNMNAAIQSDGPDRNALNANVTNTLYAVGLATSSMSLSWSNADALARSVGGNIDEFLPTFTVFGRNFGVISTSLGALGVAAGLPSLIIGITDGQMSNADWINVLQLGLGVAGVLTGGWVAFGIGLVSIGIAIATHPPIQQ